MSSNNRTPHLPSPPGIALGPDGKPCKICTSFRHWKPPSSKPTTATKSSSSPSAAIATASATAAAAAAHDDVAQPQRAHCPPDAEALGRATWTFLHTTAAYYPERPSPTQRAHMLQLLHALPTLYACGHCADDLGERLRRRPPDVRSARGFVQRTMRLMRCSASPRAIARASMSAGGMGRRTGAVTEVEIESSRLLFLSVFHSPFALYLHSSLQ